MNAITTAQLTGLGFLVLFGFAYDRAVVWYQRSGDDKFTAAPVILGVIVTVLVLYFDSFGGVFGADLWILFTLCHFAASGLGMTLGSWQRAL